MTHTALLTFAPAVGTELLAGRSKLRTEDREFFDRGSLRLKPGRVPVLVNHEDDLEVGTVRELCVFEDTNGPWHAALVSIDKPPTWLKRGTAVSMGWCHLGSRNLADWGLGDWTRVSSALVTEISILDPQTKPAEPLARVLTLSEKTERSPAAARAASPSAAGGEVIYHPRGTKVRRYFANSITGMTDANGHEWVFEH